MKRQIYQTLFLIAALCVLAPPVFSQTIKMGTMAPEGSVWHEILQTMGQDWNQISGGRVKLRIYPGGVLGDEVDMLRKVRIGQLQAAALSTIGLEKIDRSPTALQIPMLVQSYQELDYIWERMAPEIERRFQEKGYVILHWGDVGWVHYFTKRPARTLDDIRQMRLWTSVGNPEAERIYKQFGIQPVPLPATDMLTSLETGMIDAFDVPPLFALLDQTFAAAPNMIDVKWAPLVGATVVSASTWNRIPADLRPQLLAAARRAGDRLRDDVRRLGDDAVVEMQKRGLTVYRADAATLADWKAEAEAAYPALRGALVPEDLFDEAVRLRDEYEQQNTNADGN